MSYLAVGGAQLTGMMSPISQYVAAKKAKLAKCLSSTPQFTRESLQHLPIWQQKAVRLLSRATHATHIYAKTATKPGLAKLATCKNCDAPVKSSCGGICQPCSAKFNAFLRTQINIQEITNV